ncbi:uncharacterized protein LOC111624570 isoform X2 [Centruroides sculpturatus]|uniref:uncharacterized protein LOC111624570 isoform X2 n=1 Tax=Centruroides sculpturatus TaxID=218467 RepID=UPI000C6DA2D9|nr:uncharacterized protein LOC111624570 isoform X2 [Centruroides sculpturatus]
MYGNDRNRSPYYNAVHHNQRFDDPSQVKRSKFDRRPRCLHSSPIGLPSPDLSSRNASPRTPNRSYNFESPNSNRSPYYGHHFDQSNYISPGPSFVRTPNLSWESFDSGSGGKNYGKKKHNFRDSRRSSNCNPGGSDNISNYANSSMLEDPWLELERERKDNN